MAEGDSKGRGFLVVGLVVSIAALVLAPILGYVLFAAFAVLAWVRKESKATRWTLTIVAGALILLTLLGISTTAKPVDHHTPNSVILHHRP